MSLNREQALFMQHVAELIRKAPEFGLQVTGGELYRTAEQQQIYVRDGRSKTSNSQHLKRLAIDLNFFRSGTDGSMTLVYSGDEIRHLGAFWESLDPANRWGGNWHSFKDVPHFERRDGVKPAAPLPKPAPSTTARGARLLGGPVGPRSQNSYDDVESVQRLLNLNRSRFALAAILKTDGVFGQKTADAIQAFQTAVLGAATVDGVIRPGDACLAALCSKLPDAIDAELLGLAYLNAADTEVAALAPELVHCMVRYSINTPLRQAHFLAQVGHESGELRFRTELADGSAYEGRANLGNTQPGDGPRFKGRGLIQLTGRNNTEYKSANAYGVDVLAKPEQVAKDDRLCADVAGWFWNRHQLNLLADRDDLDAITRRINGGLNGLPDRRRLYARLKSLLVV
jgi:predicted chitinase/peptidoglycan hydrolase-like protein with peptidoglycan-binding domain